MPRRASLYTVPRGTSGSDLGPFYGYFSRHGGVEEGSPPEKHKPNGPLEGYDATRLEQDDSLRIADGIVPGTISDEDPVTRSTALRQTADLVEPDWIVVDDTDRVLAAVPGRDGTPVDEYEFDDVADDRVDEPDEVVRILADIRSEPVVPLFPDPVAALTDLFGDEWTDLLASDAFAALDPLHEESQSLADVIRLFERDVAGLELEDYLLETVPCSISPTAATRRSSGTFRQPTPTTTRRWRRSSITSYSS